MPYVIISTVALLSNLYKNAPLIVGDKDSDPELMRFLGARITTNYPACGSPPMYVMHAPPRTVFDNLEKRGYCLMCAQTIQEHSVWILARPRVPDDDKVEIARGGPNDKSIQAFEENEDSSKDSPASPNVKRNNSIRGQSPSKIPRQKVVSPEESLPVKSIEIESTIPNVRSKGDGNLKWLENERVHTRIQVSNSDVSVQNTPEVLTKSTYVLERKRSNTSSKHPSYIENEVKLNSVPSKDHIDSKEIIEKQKTTYKVLKESIEEPKTMDNLSKETIKEPNTTYRVPKEIIEHPTTSYKVSKETVEELKVTYKVSKETQVDFSSRTLTFFDSWNTDCINESGVFVYYDPEDARKKFNVQKPLLLDSFTQVQSEILVLSGEMVSPNLHATPLNVSGLESANYESSNSAAIGLEKTKETSKVMKRSFLISTNCNPSIAMLENPLFTNIGDTRHLACLTQENCCCEEEEA